MVTPFSVNEIITSFLDDEGVLIAPQHRDFKRTVVNREVIQSLFSAFRADEEIRNACTRITVSIKGSYLANKVVASLHPIVNDKDVEFRFFVKEEQDKYKVYEKAHKLASSYFKRHIPVHSPFSSRSLRDLGLLQDSYVFFKNMMLASIVLEDKGGQLPLELSMIFAGEKILTHLANVDSCFVPLEEFDEELGSERAGEFILCSREGENIQAILSQLERKIITSSREAWNPEEVSHYELGRYLIWIIERWTEPGLTIFPCFFQGSMRINSPQQLWLNLSKIISNKRSKNTSYPFFLLGNFLFHMPPELASVWVEENPGVLKSVLHTSPYAASLESILVSKENKLRSGPIFLLSCHLPLLADRIVVVDHLGMKQLQCCFSESGNEYAILIPIPSTDAELLSWMESMFAAAQSELRLSQLHFCALSSLPEERRGSFSFKLFEQILHLLEKKPSLWTTCQAILGDPHEVQKWMCILYQQDEEKFLRLLSLETNSAAICDLLRQLLPYMHDVSDLFGKKLEAVFDQYTTQNDPWKTFCIRFLMEAASCPPKCLQILCHKSGVVQNRQVVIDLLRFPKLLGLEEKKWIFLFKLAVLFEDSSFVMESLQSAVSNEKIQELEKAFSHSEKFKPIFEHLISEGKIQEAIRLLKVIKRAWGFKEVLPYYASFYHKTRFPSVEKLCLDVVMEALQMGEDPWRLYSLFASYPSILRTIEPFLFKDFSHLNVPHFFIELSERERQACLQGFLGCIDFSMQEADLDRAHRLVCFLPFLGAEERQAAPILVSLFEKRPNGQEGQKIACLIHALAPSLKNELFKRVTSPHLFARRESLISSHFPLIECVFALLSQVSEPHCLSLIVESLGALIDNSSEKTLSLLNQVVPQICEEDKEKIALRCTQLSPRNASIKQQIFDLAFPAYWKQAWTLASIQNVWKFVKNSSQSLEKKGSFINEVIYKIPKLMEEASLVEDMIPYMDVDSLAQLKQKCIGEIREILEGMKAGQMRSLSLIAQEPFSSFFGRDPNLYIQFLNTILQHFGRASQKDIEKIAVLLEKIPDNPSQSLQQARRDLAICCIEKSKSLCWFPWMAKDAAENFEDPTLQDRFQKVCLLNPRYSSQFLHSLAPLLGFREQDSSLLLIVVEHLKRAPSLNTEALVEIGSWLIEDLKYSPDKRVFMVIKEYILLCLRSQQLHLARDHFQHVYQIDCPLSIKKIHRRYLPFLEELLKENLNFVRNEGYVERLAHYITAEGVYLDNPEIYECTQKFLFLVSSIDSQLFQNCLLALCPSLEALPHSSGHSAAFLIYLTLIDTLPEKMIKKVYPALLSHGQEYVKQHLLIMKERFKDEDLLSCAIKLVSLYMKANRPDLAKTWIQEWTFNKIEDKEGALVSGEIIQEFYHLRWSFLRIIYQKFPSLSEGSLVIDALKEIKQMENKHSDPLLVKCKAEAFDMCSMSESGASVFIQQILDLWSHLDPLNDTEEHLKTLFACCLRPLAALSSKKKFMLEEDFVFRLLDYFFVIKERMPFSNDLYLCINELFVLSFYLKIAGRNSEFLDVLCPPLNAELDDLQSISLLINYYSCAAILLVRFDPVSIDSRQLQTLVEYIIHMNRRFITTPECSDFSSVLLANCVGKGELTLAKSLVLNVHKNRMIQFCNEKKSINIINDFKVYLEYQFLLDQESILNTGEVLNILKEQRIRTPEPGTATFELFMQNFLKTVQKIYEGGKAKPKLYHIIMSTVNFLIKEENEVSEHILQLSYYAFHCPWADFCFSHFIEFYIQFQQKEVKQEFAPIGSIYSIPIDLILDRISINFQESSFIGVAEVLKQPVGLYISFLYRMYKKADSNKLKTACKDKLVKSMQKIVKERRSWFMHCCRLLLRDFPGSLDDFQSFVDKADLSASEKEVAQSVLLFLSDQEFSPNSEQMAIAKSSPFSYK